MRQDSNCERSRRAMAFLLFVSGIFLLFGHEETARISLGERLTVRALEEARDEVRQDTKGRVDVNRRGERRRNRRGDWYITGLGCIHAF